MVVEFQGGQVVGSPPTTIIDAYQCFLGENERIINVKVYKAERAHVNKPNHDMVVGFEFMTNLRSCGINGRRGQLGYDVGFASGHQLLSMEAWWGNSGYLRQIHFYFDYNCDSAGTRMHNLL